MSALSVLLDIQSQILKGYDFAVELTKQLLTLSIGILGISITFTKDLFKKVSRPAKYCLSISWILYFNSIIFGIMHIMALTGTLMSTLPATDAPSSAEFYAAIGLISFGLATLLIVLYGMIGLFNSNFN